MRMGDKCISKSQNKTSELQTKFEKLKQRRVKLTIENQELKKEDSSNNDVQSAGGSGSIVKKEEKGRDNEVGCEAIAVAELNAYMPYSYVLSSEAKVEKKRKLENEIDRALENRDFLLSEELSDEIELNRLSEQVKGALEARDYLNSVKGKERKKSRKRKLKWAFDKKERWETKGNM